MDLDLGTVRDRVRSALAEDLGPGRDVTTEASVPRARHGAARIVAKQGGVLCGVEVAREVFGQVDAAIEAQVEHHDGDRLAPGSVVMTLHGPAWGLLAGERTALNFLQHLSGIATLAHVFVGAVAGTGARIYDTRKTTPCLRLLEKHAVRAGGACNHRFGLFDQVLLKSNHFALARPLGYEEVVRNAVAVSHRDVIAEARTTNEALAAVRGGAAVVLLDNFPIGEPLAQAVRAVRGEAERLGRRVETEASGGITLENVKAAAAIGVDRISIGALTHSARALDLSMIMAGAE